MFDEEKESASKVLIGKRVCFESHTGWCWAKVVDVKTVNTVEGPVEALLVKDRRFKTKEGRVGHVDGGPKGRPTVLRHTSTMTLIEIEESLSEDEVDKLFLTLLGQDPSDIKSVLENSLNRENIKKIIQGKGDTTCLKE